MGFSRRHLESRVVDAYLPFSKKSYTEVKVACRSRGKCLYEDIDDNIWIIEVWIELISVCATFLSGHVA